MSSFLEWCYQQGWKATSNKEISHCFLGDRSNKGVGAGKVFVPPEERFRFRTEYLRRFHAGQEALAIVEVKEPINDPKWIQTPSGKKCRTRKK